MRPSAALGLFFLLLSPPLISAADPSAAIALSPALAEWKKEIEDAGKGPVILARIYTDREQNRIILPHDIEQRDILKRYFLNPSFTDEFVEMHGANVNYNGPEGRFHFILLNMARAPEWGEREDAVLGHEFGHVWLDANNYPFPVYEGEADSCAAIQAGDAVQHVVIRNELARRGIDYRPYWTANLDKLLDALEQGPPPPVREMPVCRAAAQLVLWLDAKLGLSAQTWERYDRFLLAMDRSFPDLKPPVEELYELIRGEDVRDPQVHLRVLRQALVRMYRFAGNWRARQQKTAESTENKGR